MKTASIGKDIWNDVDNEEYRVYHYPDGTMFKVEEPVKLNIQKSSLGGHAHRILTAKGTGLYIGPGWIATEWMPKNGREVFKF